MLVNQSTRGGTDGVLWLSTPVSDRWAVTFLGGGHFQDQTDVDGDEWTDMAHLRARRGSAPVVLGRWAGPILLS